MALIDNIEVYLKLDGDSTDEVGSCDGTDANITYSDANGIINNGSGFNGSNSEIKASDSSDARITGHFTVNMWIKTVYSSVFQVAWGTTYYSSTAKYSGYRIAIGTTGFPQLFSARNTGNSSGVDYQFKYATVAIDDGNWHMVTGRYDGTNLIINVDGGDKQTVAWANGAGYDTSAFALLGHEQRVQDDDRYPMNGAVDELGLWSRALSDSEVTELYNSGAGLQYPFGGAPSTGFIHSQAIII